MKKLFAAILMMCFLFAACVCFAANSAGQPASKSWESVLSGIDQDIVFMNNLLKSLDKRLPVKIEELNRAVLNVNGHLNQIVILSGVTGDNPWAFRTVLAQVEDLRNYLVYKKHNLLQVHDSFGQVKSTWGILQQVRDEDATKGMTPGVKAEFEIIYTKYRSLKREISERKELVDQSLAGADKEIARIDARVESVRRQVIDNVADYALGFYPALFTPWGMTVFFSSLSEWPSQTAKFWGPLLSWVDFSQCVDIAVLCALILFWGGYYLVGRSMRKKNPDAKAYKYIVPLIFISAGFGLLIGAFFSYFSMNHAVRMLSRVLLSYGAGLFVWEAVRPPHEPGEPKPKTPLFVFLYISITGYLLQLVNMPPACAGPVWALVLIVFFGLLFYERKSYIGPLAKIFYRSGAFVLPAMALLSLLGMGTQMVLAAEAWTLLVLCVYVAAASRPERLVKKSGPGETVETRPPSVAYPLILLATVYTGIAFLFSYLGGRELAHWAISYSFKLGDAMVSVKSILFIICAFFLLKLAIHWIQVVIGRLCHEYAQALSNTLQVCVSYVGWLLYAVMILGVFGVPLNSLAWIASGLSVGIGFGMKDIVNNFVSGLILLFGGSVKKGDVIQHKTTVGVVTNVSIRNTTVLTLENNRIVIPNSSILKGDIINYSLEDPRMRLMIPITLAPGAKEKKFKKIALKTVKNHPNILKEPEPEILFKGFGQLGLEYTLNCWIDDFQRKFQVENELFETLNKQFIKKKVQVAFRTVKTKYKLKKTPEDLLLEMKEKRSLFYETLRKRKRMAASGDMVRKVRASWARGKRG